MVNGMDDLTYNNFKPDNIPTELKSYPNWVCGNSFKKPINPKTGGDAKANDASTWGTYKEVMEYFKTHRNNDVRTIGFEVGESPFVGIDIDHCRNAETGETELWAQEVVSTINSYTEISPSGTGIRIFVTADDQFPRVNRNKRGLGNTGKGAVEIANTGKYFSVTGNQLEGTPTHIKNRPEELRKIFNLYFPEKVTENIPETKTTTILEDQEILQKAASAKNGDAFKKLSSGDLSGYPSRSEADLAYCCMLSFWCGNDPAQIDRLFRQSGLMREKWDREDYRTQTIRKAMENTKEVYKGPSMEAPLVERDALTFPDVISGIAGEFADTYSARLEVPRHFFFMAFLTCLGNIISDRVSIDSELRTEPRLYTLLLGQSADDRKSTALSKVTNFFHEAMEKFNICWGVGSAEGLQEKLSDGNKLLLCFDEFKQFVSKCKIESSVLLPCVNSLFENTWYESRTRQKSIVLKDVHLSVLAASTVDTYERTWDPSFTDIGFNNRLFLVPGSGERKFPIPEKIPDDPHTIQAAALSMRLRRKQNRHMNNGI